LIANKLWFIRLFNFSDKPSEVELRTKRSITVHKWLAYTHEGGSKTPLCLNPTSTRIRSPFCSCVGSVLADCLPIVLFHNVLRGMREPSRFRGNDMSVVCINPQETVCIFSCPNLARKSHNSLSHTSIVWTDEQ